jgi:hypothetical protein
MLFPENSENVKRERKAKCENSVLEFAGVYFPDYVPCQFAKFHKEWEKIRTIEKEPVLVEAFRVSGKSTYFTLLDPVHEIVYGRRNFILFSRYNEEKSALFTGRILLELMFNQRLINDFGVFFPDGKKPAMERFTVSVPGSGGVRAISMGQDPLRFCPSLFHFFSFNLKESRKWRMTPTAKPQAAPLVARNAAMTPAMPLSMSFSHILMASIAQA